MCSGQAVGSMELSHDYSRAAWLLPLANGSAPFAPTGYMAKTFMQIQDLLLLR